MSKDIVVFETHTLLDIRAITVLGLNAKPNTKSPIGYFGTGLKYAIATLVRNGIRVEIHIGLRAYIFEIVPGTFRDVDVNYIRMGIKHDLLKKWRSKSLPYTTEFGRNWELWQAFRELESNTRDEGGRTYTVDNIDDIPIKSDITTIVVGPSSSFADTFERVRQIFLPNALTAYSVDKTIEVFESPSNGIYYRGIRVMDMPKGISAHFTYNILSNITLTEDRTAKYAWEIEDKIVQYYFTSTDKKVIASILNMPKDDKTYEAKLSWDSPYEQPGPTFKEALLEKRAALQASGGEGSWGISRFGVLADSYYSPPPSMWVDFDKWLSAARLSEKRGHLDEVEFSAPILDKVLQHLQKEGK